MPMLDLSQFGLPTMPNGMLSPTGSFPPVPGLDEAALAQAAREAAAARLAAPQQRPVPPLPDVPAADTFGMPGGPMPFGSLAPQAEAPAAPALPPWLSEMAKAGPSKAGPPVSPMAPPIDPAALPPNSMPTSQLPLPDNVGPRTPLAPPGQPLDISPTATMAAPQPVAAPAPAPSSISLLDRLSAGSSNLGARHGLIPGIFDAITGFQTGQRMDPLGRQIQAENQTIAALVKKGLPPEIAQAAAKNPEILKQIIPQVFGPKQSQFTQIGEDFSGNKKFGFVDPVTKTVTDLAGNPITAGGSGGSSIPTGPDGMPIQGQALLAHLEKTDPTAAAGVKGIIAGDLNMGGRNLQKLGPLAELVDPTMKQFDYQTRAKTRLDFTSGKSAQELKAINTAIGHADQLAGISPKLGGMDIAPGVLNPLIQGYKRNTGDTAFQDAKRDWDTKAETLATEVSKALNGGTPHVADKEHWRGILAAASSPTERASALKSIMGVLQSRIESNVQTYNQGMGTNREGFTFLNPENKGKYERLLATGGVEQKREGASATAASPNAAPAPGKYVYDPATNKLVPQ